MTGRACRYFSISQEIPDFLDFTGATQGTFHGWSKYDDRPIAIVEDMNGNTDVSAPGLVKFDKPYVPKI